MCINVLRAAELLCDDSNFKAGLVERLAREVAQLLCLHPLVFKSRWCAGGQDRPECCLQVGRCCLLVLPLLRGFLVLPLLLPLLLPPLLLLAGEVLLVWSWSFVGALYMGPVLISPLCIFAQHDAALVRLPQKLASHSCCQLGSRAASGSTRQYPHAQCCWAH